MNNRIQKVILNRELKRNISDIRHYEDQIEDYGECEVYRSNLRELLAEQDEIKIAYGELI